MKALCTLTVLLLASSVALAAVPPYSDDFDSSALGDYVSQQADWTPAHFDPNLPVVTDAQAFSAPNSITDNGGGVGMELVFDPPLTAPEVVLSFMFYKEDHGSSGEDDRVRLDLHTNNSPLTYSGTVVIWDGDVINDQDTGQRPVTGLSLNTWYKCELVLTRNGEDTKYEDEMTINVYNADDSLFGSGPFTMGLGSRQPLEQLADVHLSFRGGKGIHVDDLSVVPEPATMSLLAVGLLGLLRRKR
jgi:hypothetical protein